MHYQELVKEISKRLNLSGGEAALLSVEHDAWCLGVRLGQAYCNCQPDIRKINDDGSKTLLAKAGKLL